MAISPKGVLRPRLSSAKFTLKTTKTLPRSSLCNGLVAKPSSRSGNTCARIEKPLYQQLTEWHLGWVAENEDGKVVGYVGHIPLSYEFRGRQVIAACAHGLSIDSFLPWLRRAPAKTVIWATSYTGRSAHVHSRTRIRVRLLRRSVICSRVPTGKLERSEFLDHQP